MSLEFTEGKVPEGAIRLTRQEAVTYQLDRIKSWPNQFEVWPFKWGIGTMGCVSGITGVYINNYYRSKFKLRHQGLIAGLLPMFMGPPLLSTALHTQFAMEHVLLHTAKCPICLEMQAAGLQLISSIVYPVFIGLVANTTVAFHYATIRVPYWSDFQGHLKFWAGIVRPLGKKLLPISLVHVFLSGFLTYFEFKTLHDIDTKIIAEAELNRENVFRKKEEEIKMSQLTQETVG